MQTNSEQFQRELDYQIEMILAREMLEQGIICEPDVGSVEQIITQFHNPFYRRKGTSCAGPD